MQLNQILLLYMLIMYSLCKIIQTKALSKYLKQLLNKIFKNSRNRQKIRLCLCSMNKIYQSLKARNKNHHLLMQLMNGLEKPLVLLHNGQKARDCLTQLTKRIVQYLLNVLMLLFKCLILFLILLDSTKDSIEHQNYLQSHLLENRCIRHTEKLIQKLLLKEMQLRDWLIYSSIICQAQKMLTA